MLRALLLGMLSLGFAQSTLAAEPRLEPCFDYDVEEAAVINGMEMKRIQVCFTPQELPWAELDLVPYSNLKHGFDAKEAAVEFEFAGKKVQGKKLSWIRNQEPASNVFAAAIHCWVVPDLRTPSFRVRFGNYGDFLLPAGCVRLEVTPHERRTPGVSQFELDGTLAVTGEYKQATKFPFDEQALEAHELTFHVTKGMDKTTITYTISREMPWEVCATSYELEKGKASMRVKSKKPAAVPQGLQYFPQGGFAFAPPPGYAKTTDLKPGELARFVKGKDYIAVTTRELDKEGLEGLRLNIQRESREDMPKSSLRFSGYSRFHHFAGHRSFDAMDAKTKAPVIVSHHDGLAFLVAITGLDELTGDETRALFKGWRWIATANEN